MSEGIVGKLRHARNWSADAGRGSLHDDATAAKLGFRGGTVAGNIHMDQYAAALVDAFGPVWYERGALSLYFVNATTDREAVHVTGDAVVTQSDRRADVPRRRHAGVGRDRVALRPRRIGIATPGPASSRSRRAANPQAARSR
jgi:hypothetical protein